MKFVTKVREEAKRRIVEEKKKRNRMLEYLQ